ncbi:MAG: hypothetical protein UU47_C0018G0021 [candidate division TM6 bacterium GW2011_GWE2_41_16]|nr:MAG: hypothetical protein UU47_C0018G0021 [candidate division TM6 bacterium GW2011_GWE2_41_16]
MACAGLLKTTLIDYPGHVAAVVFIRGCPFRCPFCHNPELVDPARYADVIPTEDILSFLASRQGRLDGVCITGGEPTTWPGLFDFIAQVHALGFKIKLDSNGYYPDILNNILDSGLIDYVAMDIKGPLAKYSIMTGVQIDTARIVRSIDVIKQAYVTKKIADYEFRTTLVKPLLEVVDAHGIGELMHGTPHYYVQNFAQSKHVGNVENMTGFLDTEREAFAAIAQGYVKHVGIRS